MTKLECLEVVLVSLFLTLSTYLSSWYIFPSRHLLVQSQQCIQQKNKLNLLKVNKQKSHQNDVNDVVLVSLSRLNRFRTLICCSSCWLWTSIYRLGNNFKHKQVYAETTTEMSENFSHFITVHQNEVREVIGNVIP